jgi:hypothetical protein
MNKCPKCGELENFHYNYDYSKAERPILEILCNECGENFEPSLYIPKKKPKQETTFEQIDQTNPVTKGSTALVFKQESLEEREPYWVLVDKKTEQNNTSDIIPNDFTQGYNLAKDTLYNEEDMINFAFDTYRYISELMKVPFNKISENKLHAMFNLKQFKK